jgi:hypothetical protein
VHILPIQKFRLFSVQHNGQFLFVSNDFENGDRVVEALPSANEERNFFRALDDPDGRVRLFHPSTQTFVFVSNDLADTTSSDTDRIVEAHASADEERNRFEVRPQGDGSFAFFNTSTQRFLFLSNDQRDNDFVIEAHKRPGELRNRFRVEL